MIRLKRVYDDAAPDDVYRILVERLWPRGISKARAALDLWLKEIAPSPELRIWFGHDPAKWEEFRSRYWDELRINYETVDRLAELCKAHDVTFIYSSNDTQHNAAVALKEYMEQLLTDNA